MKNKVKKIVIYSVVLIVAGALIILISAYIGSQSFRNWMDRTVLQKEIENKELPTIFLEGEENTSVYAYSSYVVLLKDNNLEIYNRYGKKIDTISVQVSNPKFVSNDNYLLIADEGASKMYLIYNNNLQWEKEIEGQIAQITVNRNGAVGAIITGTTYKSVVIMYDVTGKEIFKTFLSSTYATDLAISDNSNYLSFSEINTSGVSILSKVKTVSVAKAITEPNESIIDTYEMDPNILLTKINYHKNRVIAMADDGVYVCNNGEKKKIIEINNSIRFVDINLDGNVACVKEEVSKYELDIKNVDNVKSSTYLLSDAVKEIYCNDNITAVDEGNKVEFINNSGRMIKKFTAHQNIKSIILNSSFATIIYKDKVEILDI